MLAACKDWFLRGLAGWIALPVLFAIIVMAAFAFLNGDQERVQLLAGVCETVGVGLVAYDLWSIYRKHSVAGPVTRLISYFQDFPMLRRTRKGAMSAILGSATMTGHAAVLRRELPAGATLEKKVDFLMQRFKELQEGQQNLHEALDGAVNRLSADITMVSDQLRGHEVQITQQLREIEVGDPFLAPLGLLYVAVGAALSLLA